MIARKKYSKEKLLPLGRILSTSFKGLGIDLKFTQQKVIDKWHKIVGEQIDSISKPQYFKFRTLFVNVSDSMWLHQLTFLEDEVKEKINKFAGKKLVQKIYFKVGELYVNENKQSINKDDLRINFLDFTDTNDEKEADRTLDNLNDPELKMVLKRIIMKGKGADKFRRQQKLIRTGCIKNMYSGLLLWVMVIPMLAGCSTWQYKGLDKTSVPSPAGIYEKNRVDQTYTLSPDQINANAYYYYLLGEFKNIERQYKEAVKNFQKAISYDSFSPFLYKSLAQSYMMLGKITDAINACKDALAIDPNYVDARMMLGNFYSNMGKKKLAIGQYQKVIEIDPDKENAYTILGVIYLEIDLKEKAIQTFEKLININPYSFKGYYYLGKTYSKIQLYARAAESFKKALEIDRDSLNTMESLALSYLQLKDYDNAIETYRQMLSLSPGNLQIHNRLAEIYILNNSPEQALELYEEARKVYPHNVEILLKMGLIYYEQKEYDKALKYIYKVNDEQPNNPIAHYYLGAIFESQEKYERALEELEKALKKEPKSLETRLLMGRIYEKMGQKEKTIALIKEGMEKDPHNPEIYYYLGLLKSQAEEYSEAIIYFDKAVSINPKNEAYHFNLGVALERVKKYDETIKEMKKVLEINPNHSNAHNFIGYLYADMGINLNEAEDHLNKALKLEPENGYFLDSLGWVYYKKGLFDKALEEMKKAVKFVSDDPTVYLHLGEIYFSLSNYKEAEAALEKSLELNTQKKSPLEDSEKIQKRLEKVKQILYGSRN